jgi:NADP-reducing hydrogenase subunit HndD
MLKMINKIKIKIDGREYAGTEGQTILEVAKENGIDIPSLCHHPDLKPSESCRLCLVEVKGEKVLKTACSLNLADGLEVLTDSPRIARARKTNLELIFAQHQEECDDCVRLFNCELLRLAKKFKIKINRFSDRKKERPITKCGTVVFDQTKCIDCRNCVEVCPVGFLEVEKRGADIGIKNSSAENKECINCGQCILHCPVGAIEGDGEFESFDSLLKNKKTEQIIVAQFAPSIRTSIGEEFGLPYGEIVTDKLVAGMKKLGFEKVFDTSVGADFTTFEEAGELKERLETGENLPAFSSCCPSWVKFIEFYYPEFIPNLCTSRSPQVMLGGLIKTYWAEKEKIDPKNIMVVSVMPCVSKKYEVQREELKIDGMFPVDYVMTTRELAYFLKKNKIDLGQIEPVAADNPFGDPSGAGVIYGASGGVFESALRTAYFKITGKNLADVNIREMRGLQGIKQKEIAIGEKKIKTVIVSGIQNAEKMLKELKKNPEAFQTMEVMACPGGCIGGGGQPVPTNAAIRKKRAASLYAIDEQKKLRLAHENPALQKTYAEFLTSEEIIKPILHTKFSSKKKSPIEKLKNSREVT